MQMMQRLTNQDNNTSRYTAVNLVPTIFLQVAPPNQAELLEIFNKHPHRIVLKFLHEGIMIQLQKEKNLLVQRMETMYPLLMS